MLRGRTAKGEIDDRLGLSAAEQLEVRRATLRRAAGVGGCGFGFMTLSGCIGAVALCLSVVVGGGVVSLWALIQLLIVAWFAYSLWEFARRRATKHLYAELRERGYEVCSKCGYFLGDLPEERYQCPECGELRRRLPG